MKRQMRNVRKSDQRLAADLVPAVPDKVGVNLHLDGGQLHSIPATSPEQRADAVRAVLYRYRTDPAAAFEVLTHLGLGTAARDLHRQLKAGAR